MPYSQKFIDETKAWNMCDDCGVPVVDTAAHDRFHQGLVATREQAKRHVPPPTYR